MSAQIEMPEYYRAPLTERDEITAWLLDYNARSWDRRGGFGYEAQPFSKAGFSRGPWLFCFNVKVRAHLDWSHAGLLTSAVQAGHLDRKTATDAHWLSETEQRLTDTSDDALWDAGIEDSRDVFCGRDGKPDDDGYSMLWDGTHVDTRFAFLGRSGGWLALTGFEGHRLAGDAEEVLAEMSDECLRRLYAFLVMLQHDLVGDLPSRMVHAAAAFHFFHNICGDICRTEDLVGAGI